MIDPESFPKGTKLIEIRGIYDGWSVAKLPDGTLVNRWPMDHRCYWPTRRWIDEQVDDRLRDL